MSDSEKLYDLAQRFDSLIRDGTGLFGPWTQWNPLSNGWSVDSPYDAAWVRAGPGNMAVLSFRAAKGTADDGTVIGTIPSVDVAGNDLRPAQDVSVPCVTDQMRMDAQSHTISCRVNITSSGQVKIYGVADGATWAGTAGGWYPLDAM
jgi:hypothetical protein